MFPETIPEESSGAEDEHVVSVIIRARGREFVRRTLTTIFPSAPGDIQITVLERVGEDDRRGKRSFHHIRSELISRGNISPLIAERMIFFFVAVAG